MLMWKLELQQTVHLPGEQLSSVAHNCLLYTLPCCCHEANNTYSVPSTFLQDLIPIPGSLLAQRICWLDPKVKASFLVSILLLSAKWQLAFLSAGIERKSSLLHTCVTHRGWAWKICNGSHSANIISEFLFRSYKAVIDLPIAMGLTNISLPVPTENVV